MNSQAILQQLRQAGQQRQPEQRLKALQPVGIFVHLRPEEPRRVAGALCPHRSRPVK